jgi:hypothetical protein
MKSFLNAILRLSKILSPVLKRHRRKKAGAVEAAKNEAIARINELDTAFAEYYERTNEGRRELANKAREVALDYCSTPKSYLTINLCRIAEDVVDDPERLKQATNRVLWGERRVRGTDGIEKNTIIHNFYGGNYGPINPFYHGGIFDERFDFDIIRDDLENITADFIGGDLRISRFTDNKESDGLDIGVKNDTWRSFFDNAATYLEDYDVLQKALERLNGLSFEEISSFVKEREIGTGGNNLDLYDEQEVRRTMSELRERLSHAKPVVAELFDPRNLEFYVNEDPQSIQTRDRYIEAQHKWIESMGFKPEQEKRTYFRRL